MFSYKFKSNFEPINTNRPLSSHLCGGTHESQTDAGFLIVTVTSEDYGMHLILQKRIIAAFNQQMQFNFNVFLIT